MSVDVKKRYLFSLVFVVLIVAGMVTVGYWANARGIESNRRVITELAVAYDTIQSANADGETVENAPPIEDVINDVALDRVIRRQVQDVLASLKVPPGEQGEQGEQGLQGPQGEQGDAGKDAPELADMIWGVTFEPVPDGQGPLPDTCVLTVNVRGGSDVVLSIAPAVCQ